MSSMTEVDFLKYLINSCEIGRDIGSDIGAIWLENLCRERLSQIGEERDNVKKPQIQNTIRRLLHVIGIHHWSEWHALHEDLNWSVQKRVCLICSVYETRPK